MSFQDIFKSNFLENSSSVSIIDMVIGIILAFGIGVLIFFIYKKTYAGVMYSESFGVSLIAMTMITTVVIMAVTSNVVLSLGMVGALSIVRFRTAIKEPVDIAFLFWSIAVGIVLAAGMIPLAVFGSIMIGIVLLIFCNKKTHAHPYIMVVRCMNKKAEDSVKKFLDNQVEKCVLKSKTVTKGMIEVNYEIRLKKDNTDFVNQVANMNQVESAVMVSYNGDYMS
ncbi:MAG TPA: DUF4956 domain-containing protein [Candidatus Fimimorpha faecalis]|uniref:DUF4956 domain-containing protein n=1 Tax=Candidatus Fimimorpha faecalis TaxID=2840824 RepID=A0A9D1EGV4_9FIRM|nr:DUF4956 domain-containing protein [Candidatus Fimimorpha faecalis]